MVYNSRRSRPENLKTKISESQLYFFRMPAKELRSQANLTVQRYFLRLIYYTLSGEGGGGGKGEVSFKSKPKRT